ncbi:hypothetical protein J6590_002240 [Homalodisca vitripennis]|nr:hypothetical protein J6590_002240 [Homalodisca vitripennis]
MAAAAIAMLSPTAGLQQITQHCTVRSVGVLRGDCYLYTGSLLAAALLITGLQVLHAQQALVVSKIRPGKEIDTKITLGQISCLGVLHLRTYSFLCKIEDSCKVEVCG